MVICLCASQNLACNTATYVHGHQRDRCERAALMSIGFWGGAFFGLDPDKLVDNDSGPSVVPIDSSSPGNDFSRVSLHICQVIYACFAGMKSRAVELTISRDRCDVALCWQCGS